MTLNFLEPTMLDAILHTPTFERDEPLVLMLHGFTGCAQDFLPLMPSLKRTTLAPQLPGHGQNDAPPHKQWYTMSACVRQLTQLLDTHLDTRMQPYVDLIGYSMGGRAALQLAYTHPERIRSMVLIGATPGIEDAQVACMRRESDARLADMIEKHGMVAFLKHWQNMPIIASQQRIQTKWRATMNTYKMQLDPYGLAMSLKHMGTGSMSSLWKHLHTMNIPTLLVTGDEDQKFSRIAQRMAMLMPNATHALIHDAGHCTHLEQPTSFAHITRTFWAQNQNM